MPPLNKKNLLSWLKDSKRHLDIFFACGILGIIGVLIFPIPPWLMDFLLSLSITFSVLILMTVLFIDKALDFSSFPSILLVVTMMRLALNISSTRLILAHGHEGTAAAGHVIEAFGLFVMQNSVLIGAIVFGILTIINFVVITKGSGRIAEVAARFSLDAMPGKQMAIDADLSAGLVTEEVAKKRRKELEDESTFFGSMDGANKFVRGDAIAGLIIILINFIAGIIIGVVQKNMSFDAALKTYTLLTIGDGLVAQIPALIVSTAAGLLVTKSGVKGSADKAILEQLGNFPQAMGVTSGLLAFMAIMPSIPAFPFLVSSAITGILAFTINKTKKVRSLSRAEEEAAGSSPTAEAANAQEIDEMLAIDTIKLELGYELLTLINYSKGVKLVDQIKALRKQIARDLGYVMPSVRILDNLQLDSKEYVIKIKDIECGKGRIEPNKLLVMEPSGGDIALPGEETKEPAFGLLAKWVDSNLKEQALFKEYTVVDPPTIITTHLTEVIKDNITELISYGEVQKLVNSLPEEHRKLVNEIIPTQITMTGLQRVLQGLLNEGVSIRDLPTILEAVSEIAAGSSNIMQIIEHVRLRIAKQICSANTNEKGYISVLVLSPIWEQIFSESMTVQGEEKVLSMPPSKLQEFVASVNKEFERQAALGETPVILTSPRVRPFVRSIVERFRPSLVIMSQSEIHAKAKIKSVGQI